MTALLASAAWADTTVQGTIRDAYTHEPLAGVYVQAYSNSTITSMTDSAGHYSLSVPDYVKSLRVKRAGYNTLQIPLGRRSDGVDAGLYPTAFTQSVGLADNARADLSATVSELSSDVSLDDQLSAGLGGQIRAVGRGGVPGLGSFLLLNGINSLHVNTQPLVVIDGIILDMQYDRSALHDGFYNNLLANVSIDDIASVSVLRNGTALYGARGANGVILIETKRSHSYDTKIDVNISGAFQQLPNLPEVMNASQYRTYASELIGSTNTELTDFKFLREDPNYYFYKVYHNNTDWKDQVYREAFTQRYSINVQGGDDVADYNISLGFIKSETTLKENDYSRFNLRVNSDLKLTDWFKMRIDASYSDVNRDMRNDGAPSDIDNTVVTAPGLLALIKSPFLSPWQYDNQGNLSNFLSDADDYLDQVFADGKIGEGSLANPAVILRDGEALNKNSFGNRMVTLGISPSAQLKHNITLSDAFSFVLFNTDEGNYIPVFGVPSYELLHVQSTLRNVQQSNSSHQYLIANDLRIGWKWMHDGHQLDLNGGWRYNLNRYEANGLIGYNTGNDKTPNMNKGLLYKKTPGVNEKNTTLTYYAQGAYSLWDKYYLDAAVSLETSSRFGPDAADALKMFGVAWGVFPSVSASWVVTNEDWFPTDGLVNYLRLRAGWDVTGNDDIVLNASRTYFDAVKFQESVVGTKLGGIGNTRLKWETTKRLSYGAEANLLDNRISVALHAYKSWTSDLLSVQPLAFIVGFDQNWGNDGELENAGFDIDLQGKVINRRDWQWQLGLSLGHYKNELVSVSGGDFLTDVYGGTVATQAGQPVGLFYGYQTDGVYARKADAQADGLYIVDRTGTKVPFAGGDVRFIDRDGNQEINDNDRTVIGDPNPSLYGHISSHLQWRKLSLDVLFNYSLGNDIYNYQRSLLESGSRFYNQSTALCGRWSSEGQQTDIPRAVYGDPMGNSRFSDRWIEDGSYLRLKNVTLSYTLGFNSRYIQGITLWGSAQNLFTVTKYLGSDPELSVSNNVLYQGIDCGQLPQSRTFSAGVRINL